MKPIKYVCRSVRKCGGCSAHVPNYCLYPHVMQKHLTIIIKIIVCNEGKNTATNTLTCSRHTQTQSYTFTRIFGEFGDLQCMFLFD